MKTLKSFICESSNIKHKPLKDFGFKEISSIDISADNESEELEFVCNLASHGILCNRLNSIGPGGGNPEYQLIPTSEKSRQWLIKWIENDYCQDPEDAQDIYSELY